MPQVSRTQGWFAAAVLIIAVVVLGLAMMRAGPSSSGREAQPAGSGNSASDAPAADAAEATPAPLGELTQPGELIFTASGDFDAGKPAQAVFDQIAALDSDLHLALGDLSYGETDTERQWCRMVTSAVGTGFPFQLVAGNHESNGRDGDIDEFVKCLPNRLSGMEGSYGRQWYADVPQENPLVRFVMISPGLEFSGLGVDIDEPDAGIGEDTWTYEAGTERYEWTAEAIDGARAESIPWVVVGMHNPCLSVGEYDCDSGTDIHDLLLDKAVDVVLHGHEHLYQRTHQLAAGPGCGELEPDEFSAQCIADADSAMGKGAGTVFATVGTGGRELREVHSSDSEARYFAAVSGEDSNPTYGSLQVRLTANELSAAFHPAYGGDFTDAFTIRRQ